eukprot:gene12989-biopygen9134
MYFTEQHAASHPPRRLLHSDFHRETRTDTVCPSVSVSVCNAQCVTEKLQFWCPAAGLQKGLYCGIRSARSRHDRDTSVPPQHRREGADAIAPKNRVSRRHHTTAVGNTAGTAATSTRRAAWWRRRSGADRFRYHRGPLNHSEEAQ